MAVAVALLLPALALYGPVTIGGRTLVPYDALVADPVYRPALEAEGVTRAHNDLVGDLVFQNDVWKRFLADAVRDGDVPLWNPNIFGGVPFLAAGQHSALYPPTALFLVLDAARAFGWNALLAAWLAALGMYMFGRSLGLRIIASALMGVAWSLGLPFVTNTVFPMIQGVFVWTPVLLAGIESVIATARDQEHVAVLPRGRLSAWLIVIAVATALAALAGHVELLYYAGLLGAAFACFRLGSIVRPLGARAAVTVGVWLAAAAMVGALVAAVQLVPLAELVRANWRSGSEVYETVVSYAYGLRQAATFLVPDFYGNPAHHAVWDIARGYRRELLDHAMWGTDWGTKNYVEAAAYVGVLPLVLAAYGLFAGRRRQLVAFLVGVAGVSLSFAFGLPTYRLLFAGLPGFDQLHTPFRWVFPFALAVIVLAGIGADRLFEPRAPRGGARLVGAVAATCGLALAVMLWTALQMPDRWTDLVDGLLGRSSTARDAVMAHFPDPSAFASYQFWNFAHLAVFLTLSGAVFLLTASAAGRSRPTRAAAALALAVAGIDLWLIGFGFNPALDLRLAEIRPPALVWLGDAVAAKWGRVIGFGADKVLWPNSAMRGPVPDVRGYDSVIPRWTVETFNAIAAGGGQLDDPSARHGMLTYNRFGNLTDPGQLTHPGLAALGARYIVTTERLDVPTLKPVFPSPPDADTEAVRIYENRLAMPRAWVVDDVRVIEDRAQLLGAMAAFDPQRTVLLEEAPADVWAELAPGRRLTRPSTVDVREDTATNRMLEVEVSSPNGGMLVVSEAWFPGWQAEVLAAGTTDAVSVPVYRADGMLRAVPVPPGLSTVRLRYSPMSAKVGLYGAFLGAVILLLAAAYAFWARIATAAGRDDKARLATNISGPMGASLLNKVIDFAFAMLMLRILGDANAGHYYYAINVIGLAEILGNFGLNVLAARDIARRPEDTGRILTQTTILRLVLWLAVLPVVAGYLALQSATGHPIGRETAIAIVLLAIALLPGSLSAGLSAVFQGRERMTLPAGVSIVTTLLKVSLGALALLAGYGFVGLAAVAVFTNVLTLLLLASLAWHDGIRPAASLSVATMWAMGVLSLPLMLNHLLQTVFFKIDVLMLERFQGPEVVGWYSAAYKWIDALLIIPPAVIMALFPLLSRRAVDDHTGLRRAFERVLRWLLALALPVAAATTFAAEPLIKILGGPAFLPHGATALQIMIWFLPFSFVNGLTQYVLVALDRRRWITGSFAVAATFNIVANWYVIPRYSYGGAAVVTILSELVLMVPFLTGLKSIGRPPLLVLLWRPALATSLMALVMGGLDSLGVPIVLSLPAGAATYVAALVRLGGFPSEDRALLKQLLPGGPVDASPPD